MKLFLLVCCAIAYCSAMPWKSNEQTGYDTSYVHGAYGYETSYGGAKSVQPAKPVKSQPVSPQNNIFTYNGKYEGSCGKDGFYYNDADSFVICSNSNAYVQPCAPGSRNSGFDSYNFGDNYNYRDFCDINLVDQGYGAQVKHSGYAQPEVHYKAPAYPEAKSPQKGYGYQDNKMAAYPEVTSPKKSVKTYEAAPKKPAYVSNKKSSAYNQQYIYHGKYEGYCAQDGFYYRDHGSFVICSNNNAYVQPCAPGSRNSGFDNYNFGDNYYYRDFCDINLVDQGYGVQNKQPVKLFY